ncbi:MAG: protein-L-isoaspartate carboxylmethyltransferase [Methanospirillum sp.]|nr:protein-L-isoaspartate carboxylmethyltransferase [Methanospirillum sp.]
MFAAGDRVLLAGNGREFFVRAGDGVLSTDLGMIDLAVLDGLAEGAGVETHLGKRLTARRPRPTDFFAHARRSGAPMHPKEIGSVIANTGMNRRDRVMDAGTGSGIAAIYFGSIAASVETRERRPEFAALAEKNVRDAGLENVTVVAGEMLEAGGTFDVVHLDMECRDEHVEHAHGLLVPGGYLACYTPFIEQFQVVHDTASRLFGEVRAIELIEREMTRSARGTRPSTRVCHTGYLTFARR